MKLYGFPRGTGGKKSTYNAGDLRDTGSMPGSGRSPGGGNGNPLQHSCLKNPMDRGVWKSIVHGACNESDMTEQLITHMPVLSRNKSEREIFLRNICMFPWVTLSLLKGKKKPTLRRKVIIIQKVNDYLNCYYITLIMTHLRLTLITGHDF